MVFDGPELKKVDFALAPKVSLGMPLRVDRSMRVQGACTPIVNSTMGVEKLKGAKSNIFESGTIESLHKKCS